MCKIHEHCKRARIANVANETRRAGYRERTLHWMTLIKSAGKAWQRRRRKCEHCQDSVAVGSPIDREVGEVGLWAGRF